MSGAFEKILALYGVLAEEILYPKFEVFVARKADETPVEITPKEKRRISLKLHSMS